MLPLNASRSTISVNRFSTFFSTILLLVVVVVVDSLTIDWSYDGTAHNGKFKRKQCHPIKFMLSGVFPAPSTTYHELFLFRDWMAYLEFDLTGAIELFPLTEVGESTTSFTIGENDFETGTKYYGCTGDHSSGENVRVAVQTKPDFVERYPGRQCMSNVPPQVFRYSGRRNEKKCKKRCERKHGCVAYQHHFRKRRLRGGRIIRRNKCKVYTNTYPTMGVFNRYAVCSIAKRSCAASPTG